YVAELRNALGYESLELESTSEIFGLGTSNTMKLLAVRTYAAGEPQWRVEGVCYLFKGGFFQGGYPDWILYAYLPGKYVCVPDKGRRLELMRSPVFDPYRTGVSGYPVSSGLDGGGISPVMASLEREGPDFQTFHVVVKRKALVAFSEVMYPGWRAWVDGQ